MKKILSLFLIAGTTICLSPAIAQNAPAPSTKTVKKVQPKAAEASAKSAVETADDDHEPDIASSIVTEYHCELGNKITIYRNVGDEQRMGMRWQSKVHGLKRVGTSTGANRFENKRSGLVWIDIPAKGMLLDSKKGKQLANECKTAEQMEAKKKTADEAPKSTEAAK
ncbi:hypothetical protein BH11PSE11_BH11PSE11_03980 [soil metagenome]